MLLSEATATSIGEIRRTFEAAFPNMSAKELFGLINILYKFQTHSEQKAGNVHIHNNAGFSVSDAKTLTSMHDFFLKRGFYTDKQKGYIVDLLRKHCGQLIRYWIDRGVIKHNARGMYSYESKAEREARRTAEADAKVAAGAQQFRQQFAASQTPEAKAAERVKQNHGQLDFLNDLM